MDPRYFGRLRRRENPLLLRGIEPKFRGRPVWVINYRENGEIMDLHKKKDAESQSKHNFLLCVNQLRVSAIYSHYQAERRTINLKKKLRMSF